MLTKKCKISNYLLTKIKQRISKFAKRHITYLIEEFNFLSQFSKHELAKIVTPTI